MDNILPIRPLGPPTRLTAAKSLRIMAHINDRQARTHRHRGNEFLRQYHAAASADFSAAADRLSSSSSPISNPLSPISSSSSPISDLRSPISTL